MIDAGVEVIPLARPVIGANEERRVLEVLRSGSLSLGPLLAQFERAFATRLGVACASAVSSGTATLPGCSSTNACRACALRADTMTCAPRACSSAAVARPMPLEAPTSHTRRPCQ